MFSIIYFWSGPSNLIWATYSCVSLAQVGHQLLKFNDIPASSMMSASISYECHIEIAKKY